MAFEPKVLMTTGAMPYSAEGASASVVLNSILPSQTGNIGLVLKTDGSNPSWESSWPTDLSGFTNTNNIGIPDSTTITLNGSNQLQVAYPFSGIDNVSLDNQGGRLEVNSNWASGLSVSHAGTADYATSAGSADSGWPTNLSGFSNDVPFIAAVDGYAPFADNSSGANWLTSAPTNVNDAINRIAAVVSVGGTVPIP